LASSRKYERVWGLKKKRINSLIRVFDAIIPDNRLSKLNLFMSSFSIHFTITQCSCQLHKNLAKIVPIDPLKLKI
jgi:hypothetical protein